MMENLTPILFWILAGLTGFCAVAVVVTQNIVRAATWLLFTLAGTSGIFFLLGADLVGATQLLVYVGGTLILVVFGVMLTAQGPFISMKTGSVEYAISAVVGLMLLGVLAVSINQLRSPPPKVLGPLQGPALEYAQRKTLAQEVEKKEEVTAKVKYTAVIGQGFLGVGVGPAHSETITTPDGKKKTRVIRTHYLLPFEIVSVHLLVVLIGAAYLARAKRRQKPPHPALSPEERGGMQEREQA